MRGLALGLIFAAALLGQARYARLGEMDGRVEVRMHPTAAWRPGLRNMALVQTSAIRTGPAAHVEIELDEGSVLRLAADSSCELADYTRLSTGQRITRIFLDRGTAYFSGEPLWRDALILAMPGAQTMPRRGSRMRAEVEAGASELSVMEGEVRFSSPAVELDVTEGKSMRIDPLHSGRFVLSPEINPLESDAYSRRRDLALAGGTSAMHLAGVRYGARDLDAHGTWIDAGDFGLAWKPKLQDGWIPFRDGRWEWYEGIGYTWIGSEPWGWLPYHYGRWMLHAKLGWFWVPSRMKTFHPGDVY